MKYAAINAFNSITLSGFGQNLDVMLLCYAFCQGLGRQIAPKDDLLEVGSGKRSERWSNHWAESSKAVQRQKQKLLAT